MANFDIVAIPNKLIGWDFNIMVYIYVYIYMGMDQYLLIPFLVGWTSIYQLFWGSLGTRVVTHPHII